MSPVPHLTAWLAGVLFQLGNWPALTHFIVLGSNLRSGNFRLQHWPPLEAELLSSPRLAMLLMFVRSDAVGLRQVDYTICSLMLSTSGSWHKETDKFY